MDLDLLPLEADLDLCLRLWDLFTTVGEELPFIGDFLTCVGLDFLDDSLTCVELACVDDFLTCVTLASDGEPLTRVGE